MSGVGELPRASVEAATASFKAAAPMYGALGGVLYAALCKRTVDDPELVDIASHGLASATCAHLLAAVHYLLLRDPRDPLARYYATLTENPAPAEEAFPDFARYCKAHREEIVQILKTRTVQATLADRCQSVMPPLSHVAKLAGEPLNIVEIGCSAGVLLTFDQHGYALQGRGLLGPKNAPLTLNVDVRGGPALHIPMIGKRIGVDLRPVDVKLADERRWLLALFVPEWRERYQRLATALDVVAQTDIDFIKGDALDLLPEIIAENQDPLCIFHSACLLYWSAEQKTALETMLLEASHGRALYRVGVELAQGQPMTSVANMYSEIVLARYRDGAVQTKVVAHALGDGATVQWLDGSA